VRRQCPQPAACAHNSAIFTNLFGEDPENINTGRIVVKNFKMKCDVIDVRTESGICPGEAETQNGEQYVLGARTPESNSICANALAAIHPMSLAMRMTDKMYWEKKDHFDLVCPHGAVTFRISRIRQNRP
jgi:uncharacterized repeat protein (TIGR04076 family)